MLKLFTGFKVLNHFINRCIEVLLKPLKVFQNYIQFHGMKGTLLQITPVLNVLNPLCASRIPILCIKTQHVVAEGFASRKPEERV